MEPGMGKLVIEVISAHKLRKVERFFGTQDPYIVASIEGNSSVNARTATHFDSGSEPRWKESGLLNTITIPFNVEDKVTLIVMDDNGKKADVEIGTVSLDLKNMIASPGEPIALENLPVVHGKKQSKAGTLHAIIRYEPETDQNSSKASTKQAVKERTGNLRLVIKEAVKLKSLQSVLAQTVYIQVNHLASGAEHCTKQSKGKNPKWGENKDGTMELNEVVLGENSTVSFTAMEVEMIRSDRVICVGSFGEDQIEQLGSEPAVIEVQMFDPKQNPAGTLLVEARFDEAKKSAKSATQTDSDSETKTKRSKNERKSDERQEERTSLTRDIKNEEHDITTPKEAPNGISIETPGWIVVKFTSATKLKNVQRLLQQDPFVRATLLPWQEVTLETKPGNGINPKWNSSKNNEMRFKFHGDPGKKQTVQLQVDVLDAEVVQKARLIGSAILDVGSIIPALSRSQNDEGTDSDPPTKAKQADIALFDAKQKPAGTLHCSLRFEADEIEETIKNKTENSSADFALESGMLAVTALSANLTRDVEYLGKQDPFMRVVLLPWAGDEQQGRTKSKSNAGKKCEWSAADENEMQLFLPGQPDSGQEASVLIQVLDAEGVMKALTGERIIGETTVSLRKLLDSQEIHEVELFYMKKSKNVSAGKCSILVKYSPGAKPPKQDKNNKNNRKKNKFEGLGTMDKLDAETIGFDKAAQLQITFERAVNLKNRAWMGKQDPYVSVTLLPWKISYRTRCVPDGGTDVEWTAKQNNYLEINYPGAQADQHPSMLVQVFDEQPGGDRIIGECTLLPSVFLLTKKRGKESLEIPLVYKNKPAGVLHCSVSCAIRKGILGTRAGTLQVVLVGTSMNKEGDWFGKGDPYVTINPCPSVRHVKDFSSVVKMNAGLSAEFEQSFEIPIFDFGIVGAGAKGEKQSLKIAVMDKDTWTADDVIGSGLRELDEVFLGGSDYDPNYAHETAMMSGKYARGFVYTKLKFNSSTRRGLQILDVLAEKPGILRVWCLEARSLKHVGGMLDSMQDPFLAVMRTLNSNEEPGSPKTWPKEQSTPVAEDAGTACVWNYPIELEHTSKHVGFAASKNQHGQLHIAVLDAGLMSNTLIGTAKLDIHAFLKQISGQKARRNDSDFRDDVWISIVDSKNKRTGQVRVALEYAAQRSVVSGQGSRGTGIASSKDKSMSGSQAYDTLSRAALVHSAKREHFGYIPDGTFHIIVVGVSGVPVATTKAMQVQVLVKGKRVGDKAPSAENSRLGRAVWKHGVVIDHSAPALNAISEQMLPVPMIEFQVRGEPTSRLSKMLSSGTNIGSVNVPLAAFVADTTEPNAVGEVVVKYMNLSRGNGKDSESSAPRIEVVGLFVPKGQEARMAPDVAQLEKIASELGASSTSESGVVVSKQDGKNTKSSPQLKQRPGRMHLRILKGEFERDLDMIGKQDPFVTAVLKPSSTTQRTDTCEDGGKTPVWTKSMNNQFEFLVLDADTAVLRLECMDEDSLTASDEIGVAELFVGKIARDTVPNLKESGGAGQLGDELKEPWLQLFENDKLRENDSEIDSTDLLSIRACKAVFDKPAWTRWVNIMFGEYTGTGELNSKKGWLPRRERLIAFYEQYSDISKEEKIKTKVDGIESKYKDEETTNKSLFTQLYNKYAPHERCPTSVWRKPRLKLNSGEPAILDRDEFARIVDFLEPRADEMMELREGSLTLGDERAKVLDSSFKLAAGEHVSKALSSEAFEQLARVVLSQLFAAASGSGVVDLETLANVGTDLASLGGDGTGQHELWVTVQRAGKIQGRILIETWFTEDWSPPDRSVPVDLLQNGTLHVRVTRTEFLTDKDWFGKQDPFIMLDWARGSKEKPHKSVVKSNAAKNLEWGPNEATFAIKYDPEIAFLARKSGCTPTIRLRVADKDLLSSDTLGETQIPMLPFASFPGVVVKRELPLYALSGYISERTGVIHCLVQFIPSSSDENEGDGNKHTVMVPFENAKRNSSNDENELTREVENKFEDEEEGLVKLEGNLVLKLHAARHLKDVQWVGKMDPVCTLRMWPQAQVASTKEARDQDQNPVWNEDHTLDVQDALLSVVEVNIHSSVGGKLLGTMQIPLFQYAAELTSTIGSPNDTDTDQEEIQEPTVLENWFPLSAGTKSENTQGEVHLSMQFISNMSNGSDDLGLGGVSFVAGPGELHLKVVRAIDLRSVELTGKQDPYVELHSIGWRKVFETKSPVDENGGRNPTFEFLSSGSIEWTPKDKRVPVLEVCIKDRGTLKNTTIASTKLCVAPWLLCPGQVSSMWIPLYEEERIGARCGPYKHVPKRGLVLVYTQYIPNAKYPGKPVVPFSKSALENIHMQRSLGLSDSKPGKLLSPETSKPVCREGDVHVQVISARKLANIQMLGTQDPYVKLTLISNGGHVPIYVSAKTDYVNNGGSNPKWSVDLMLPFSESALVEAAQAAGVTYQGSTPLLLCEVWNANNSSGSTGGIMRDSRIGRAICPIFPFLLDGGQVIDTWLPIVNGNGEKSGDLHIALQWRNQGAKVKAPESQVSENILNVVVVRARNLHDVGDLIGQQDPQVHIELIGNDAIVKSTVADGQGTEAYWGERLQLSDCMPDARGTLPRLRVTVVDVDSGSADDFIGMCEVSLTRRMMGDKSKGIEPVALEDWFTLRDRNGQEDRGQVQLIIKRGPFPGDAETQIDDERSEGRVVVQVVAAHELSDEQGKTPLRPFIRLTSEHAGVTIGTRDSHESKGKTDSPMWNTTMVLPVHKNPQNEGNRQKKHVSVLRADVYQRQWSIRGHQPTLVAEGVFPHVDRLIQTPGEFQDIHLSLQAPHQDQGAQLGTVDLRAQYVPPLAGQIRVLVSSVTGVRSRDLLSKNDLCVECKVDNGWMSTNTNNAPQSQRTAVKSGAGSAAEFGETLHLIYTNLGETLVPMLRVRVLDIDTISDDLCGACFVPLLDLMLRAHKYDNMLANLAGNLNENGYGAPVLQGDYPLYKRSDRPDDPKIMNESGSLKVCGTIKLEIKFLSDSKVIEKVKAEESKQVLELKRMWNIMDRNHDGRLTKEELIESVAEHEDCAKYLGVSYNNVREIRDIFDEMNTDHDEVVDYNEFRTYIETIPIRKREVQEKRELQVQARLNADDGARRKAESKRKELMQQEKRNRQLELNVQKRRAKEAEAREMEERHNALDEIRRRNEQEQTLSAARRAEEQVAYNSREVARREEEIAVKRKVREQANKTLRNRPANVLLWRTRDVAEWLDLDLDLPQYVAAFAEAAVDGAVVVNLTESDLCDHLGVVLALHRRKIMLRAAQLLQQAVGDDEEKQDGLSGGRKSSRSRPNTGTSTRGMTSQDLEERGQNEVTRALLVKKLRDEAKFRKMEEEKSKARAQIESFEYDQAPQDEEESNGSLDAIDWFRNGHEGRGIESRTPSPRRRRPPSPFRSRQEELTIFDDEDDNDDDGDEDAFRQTMSKLRNHLARDTQMVGRGSVSSQRQRMVQAPQQQNKKQPLSLRKIASDATGLEILEVVKIAVNEYANTLRTSAQENGQYEEDSLEFGNSDTASAFGGDFHGGLTDHTGEEQDLKRVYESFQALRNRKRGHHTTQLTRLKFHGALRVLLHLDLDWPQFDRVFALVTPRHGDGTDGSVQWTEFRDAMLKNGPYNNVNGINNIADNNKYSPQSPSTRSRGGVANGPRRRTALSATRPQSANSAFGGTVDTSEINLGNLRGTLYRICALLMKSKLSLKDVFRAFDRDASGSISIAEFSSLMRMLGEKRLNKKEIYYLMHCLDRVHDRRVDIHEFVEFWLVVHVKWLEHLSRTTRSGPRMEQVQAMIPRVRKALQATFGKDFENAVEAKRNLLTPSFANLLSAPSPTKRGRNVPGKSIEGVVSGRNEAKTRGRGGLQNIRQTETVNKLDMEWNGLNMGRNETVGERNGIGKDEFQEEETRYEPKNIGGICAGLGDEMLPAHLQSKPPKHFSRIHMDSSVQSGAPRRPFRTETEFDEPVTLQEQAGSTLNVLLSRYLEPSPGDLSGAKSKPRGTGMNAVRSQQRGRY